MNLKQKLVSFEIDGLFGWEKEIRCNLDFDQSISFLSGRNGSGKTTVLKLLHNLSSSNWSYIDKVRFMSFSVVLKSVSEPNNISEIKVFSENGKKKISLKKPQDDSPQNITDLPTLDKQRAKSLAETLYKQGFISKAFCGRHWASHDNNHMTDAEAVQAYGGVLLANDNNNDSMLRQIRAVLTQWNTHLIETNRLYSQSSQSSNKLSVDDVPNRILNYIRRVDQRSSVNSQALESKLVNDILSSSTGEITSISKESLKARLSKMNKHQQDLKSIGLYAESQDYTTQVDTVSSDTLLAAENVLTAFEDRIRPYLSTLVRVNIFHELLSSVCPGLKFQINRNQGLLINKGDIQPCDLSSGQQHQLLMLCNLVFERQDSELILIDEPEMSMDIEWQNEIATRLDKIAEFNNCNFLLATHSPSVVAGRWENEYDLSE